MANGMYFPSEKEFLNLTKQGNLIPVYREISGDLETPVSAYFKIAGKSKYSFLLESVEGEEKVARFSFLARDPEVVIQTKDGAVKVIRYAPGKKPSVQTAKVKDTPLSFIRDILKQYKFVALPGLPRFCGGLVGYLGYDIVRFFEKLPHTTKDDLKLPDTCLVLAKDLVIFDHINHKMKVISCAYVDPKSSSRKKLQEYKKSGARIDTLVRELNKPLVVNVKPAKGKKAASLKVKSNFTSPQFEKNRGKSERKDPGRGHYPGGTFPEICG